MRDSKAAQQGIVSDAERVPLSVIKRPRGSETARAAAAFGVRTTVVSLVVGGDFANAATFNLAVGTDDEIVARADELDFLNRQPVG
jgi:hypothetical protein